MFTPPRATRNGPSAAAAEEVGDSYFSTHIAPAVVAAMSPDQSKRPTRRGEASGGEPTRGRPSRPHRALTVALEGSSEAAPSVESGALESVPRALEAPSVARPAHARRARGEPALSAEGALADLDRWESALSSVEVAISVAQQAELQKTVHHAPQPDSDTGAAEREAAWRARLASAGAEHALELQRATADATQAWGALADACGERDVAITQLCALRGDLEASTSRCAELESRLADALAAAASAPTVTAEVLRLERARAAACACEASQLRASLERADALCDVLRARAARWESASETELAVAHAMGSAAHAALRDRQRAAGAGADAHEARMDAQRSRAQAEQACAAAAAASAEIAALKAQLREATALYARQTSHRPGHARRSEAPTTPLQTPVRPSQEDGLRASAVRRSQRLLHAPVPPGG